MARFYGPDAGDRLRERQFRGNEAISTSSEWGHYEDCACRYCSRRREAVKCENCGRETEFLFDGTIDPLAVDKDGWPMLTKKELGSRYESGGAHIPGKVCQRCRPASNLEIQEILAASKQAF